MLQHELKPDGRTIPVTNENKDEYVKLDCYLFCLHNWQYVPSLAFMYSGASRLVLRGSL